MPKKVCISDFHLEGGGVLRNAFIVYHSWGSLNRTGDNVIVVCHSLTSDSDAASWWSSLIGPERVLDTDHYFVICLNTVGSPYGSVSPLSINPDTGASYGARFPDVTNRDTVRAHREALRILGVRKLALAIGGSMGGMQVLEWGFYRDFVDALIPIAVGGKHAPWGIAWTEAQRQAIYADPKWKDGNYLLDDAPADGLAVARMMAIISYRSPIEFEDRFGRRPSSDGHPGFNVESYLRHHGQKLVDRFDANCYVHLTKQMNTHDVSRGRGQYKKVLGQLSQRVLVIGVSSDMLYPVEEQKELASLLPNADLKIIDAPFGHDSFLVVADQIGRVIKPFIELLAVVGERGGPESALARSTSAIQTLNGAKTCFPFQSELISN